MFLCLIQLITLYSVWVCSWSDTEMQDLHKFICVVIIILFITLSCGGNMLMNVGPTKDGKIIPIFEERLRQFGGWLAVNGEGVYSTVPWSHQKDNATTAIWYKTKV